MTLQLREGLLVEGDVLVDSLGMQSIVRQGAADLFQRQVGQQPRDLL